MLSNLLLYGLSGLRRDIGAVLHGLHGAAWTPSRGVSSGKKKMI